MQMVWQIADNTPVRLIRNEYPVIAMNFASRWFHALAANLPCTDIRQKFKNYPALAFILIALFAHRRFPASATVFFPKGCLHPANV
jgi:hypothetical protein